MHSLNVWFRSTNGNWHGFLVPERTSVTKQSRSKFEHTPTFTGSKTYRVIRYLVSFHRNLFQNYLDRWSCKASLWQVTLSFSKESSIWNSIHTALQWQNFGSRRLCLVNRIYTVNHKTQSQWNKILPCVTLRGYYFINDNVFTSVFIYAQNKYRWSKHVRVMLNVAIFRKWDSFFKSPKKVIPNHYPELEIQKNCFVLWAGISNFKFRIVIWRICLEIWRFKKWISQKSHL